VPLFLGTHQLHANLSTEYIIAHDVKSDLISAKCGANHQCANKSYVCAFFCPHISSWAPHTVPKFSPNAEAYCIPFSLPDNYTHISAHQEAIFNPNC
jgi:hypothetical protein